MTLLLILGLNTPHKLLKLYVCVCVCVFYFSPARSPRMWAYCTGVPLMKVGYQGHFVTGYRGVYN